MNSAITISNANIKYVQFNILTQHSMKAYFAEGTVLPTEFERYVNETYLTPDYLSIPNNTVAPTQTTFGETSKNLYNYETNIVGYKLSTKKPGSRCELSRF